MQQNRICFLMPLYPPHYDLARDFCLSVVRYDIEKQADIAFIFSTESDKNHFIQQDISCPYHTLIVPQELCVEKNQGIINIKKLYALYQLKNNYEYIIIIDSESRIIRNINLLQMCKEFDNNKILYGNTSLHDWSLIVEHSKRFYNFIHIVFTYFCKFLLSFKVKIR